GGDRLYLEKNGKTLSFVCFGIDYCHSSRNNKTINFSKEYTVKYVLRSKDKSQATSATITSIEKTEKNETKIIFKNDSLWKFYYSIYLLWFITIPILIWSIRNFWNALFRIICLINR
uniref:hypothetical protein n=1 Tax=Suttonella ornithocola TaxID=279832 RepID=UPI001B804127